MKNVNYMNPLPKKVFDRRTATTEGNRWAQSCKVAPLMLPFCNLGFPGVEGLDGGGVRLVGSSCAGDVLVEGLSKQSEIRDQVRCLLAPSQRPQVAIQVTNELPRSLGRLHHWVFMRRQVSDVVHPAVPFWWNLRSVHVVLDILNPAMSALHAPPKVPSQLS